MLSGLGLLFGLGWFCVVVCAESITLRESLWSRLESESTKDSLSVECSSFVPFRMMDLDALGQLVPEFFTGDCIQEPYRDRPFGLYNLNRSVLLYPGGSNPATTNPTEGWVTPAGYAMIRDVYYLHNSSCVVRSPRAPPTCESVDTCSTVVEFSGYTWVEIAQFLCSASVVDRSAPSLTYRVASACQIHNYPKGSLMMNLHGPGGLEAMMFHSDVLNPDPEKVTLPAGWWISGPSPLEEDVVLVPNLKGVECGYLSLYDSQDTMWMVTRLSTEKTGPFSPFGLIA